MQEKISSLSVNNNNKKTSSTFLPLNNLNTIESNKSNNNEYINNNYIIKTEKDLYKKENHLSQKELKDIKDYRDNKTNFSYKDLLTKKSTFAFTNKSSYNSANYNNIYENNLTNNSLNYPEENKFKLEYEQAKKEEFQRNKYERISTFQIKVERNCTKKLNKQQTILEEEEFFEEKKEKNLNILNILDNKDSLPFFSKAFSKIKEIKKSKGENFNNFAEGSLFTKKRYDSHGTEIKKNSKTHKVNFVDKLPGKKKKNLVDKVKIKSFKAYNIRNDEEENDKVFCGCGFSSSSSSEKKSGLCVIF